MSDALDEPYLAADALRVGVAALALWLSAVILRIGWVRARDYPTKHPDRPHPAMYFAFGLLLALTAFDRVGTLGEPLNVARMGASLLVVGLALWGLLKRYRFTSPVSGRRRR